MRRRNVLGQTQEGKKKDAAATAAIRQRCREVPQLYLESTPSGKSK